MFFCIFSSIFVWGIFDALYFASLALILKYFGISRNQSCLSLYFFTIYFLQLVQLGILSLSRQIISTFSTFLLSCRYKQAVFYSFALVYPSTIFNTSLVLYFWVFLAKAHQIFLYRKLAYLIQVRRS